MKKLRGNHETLYCNHKAHSITFDDRTIVEWFEGDKLGVVCRSLRWINLYIVDNKQLKISGDAIFHGRTISHIGDE